MLSGRSDCPDWYWMAILVGVVLIAVVVALIVRDNRQKRGK